MIRDRINDASFRQKLDLISNVESGDIFYENQERIFITFC